MNNTDCENHENFTIVPSKAQGEFRSVQYIVIFQTQLTLTANFTEYSVQMNRKLFPKGNFISHKHKIIQNPEQDKMRDGRLNQCRAQLVFPVSAIEAEHEPISFILESSHWQTS